MTIAMIFLIAMVCLVSFTVFTRYVFNFTIRWSDEVALLFMIGFGFTGIAFGVRRSIHLSIEYFMDLLPDRFQIWISRVEYVLVTYFGWALLKYGIQLYHSTKATKLPATQFSRGLLFITVPVCGFFIMIFSLEKLVRGEAKK